MQYRTGGEAFWDGVRTLLPATLGVIPFGLVTGIAAVEQGMSPGTTLGMTLLFYSGAAQMAALQLLRHDAFAPAILLTALVINLRFLMYSASLAPHLHQLPRRWTWPLSYMLGDQPYALTILRFSSGELERFGHLFFAGTAVSMWLVWLLSVMAGLFLGTDIPGSWSLDFAIPLVFLALLMPAIRSSATLGAACISGLVAVLAAHLPYNLWLPMASVCGILTGLSVEHFRSPPSESRTSEIGRGDAR